MCDIIIGREILQLGFGVMIDASKCTMYKVGQKYFHKTKVKYTHNLNLHLVNFGINEKVICMPFE